jgi:NAD(P)H-nitrite reductase large subunit
MEWKPSSSCVDEGIIVNQYMQTNKPDIYAAGDVVKFYDPIFEKFRKTEHWDTAIKQGKIAAANMLGFKHHNRTASYLSFFAFDKSFVIVGDATDTDECIVRGSIEEKNFALLYLKEDILHAATFCGRTTTEIKAAESLIVNHVNLKTSKNKIIDISFPIEPLATQILLTPKGYETAKKMFMKK